MKYLVVLLFLFLSKNSSSQKLKKEEDDLLAKYSYLLVGIKTIDTAKTIFPLGTCFFARRGKDLFLITAKHCVNGYNTFNKNPTPSQFDTIGFKYYNSTTQQICFSSLSIKSFKKLLPNNYFFESPDLVVMQMRDTFVEQYINSLEGYIFENKYDDEVLDSVIAIGFGYEDPSTFSATTPPMYYKGVIADAQDKAPLYPVNDSLYYVTQPKTIQGMSGSPVFLKFHSKGKKNKREHILFGGVVFGMNEKYNSTYIVSPGVVKDQIMEFFSSQK